MDKKELIKAIETAAAKRTAAFSEMIEKMSDEAINAYESALKVENVLRTQLAALESKEAGVPANLSEDKPAELSEAQKFIKSLREALAIGDTYTALVPAEIASQIQKKRDELSGLRKYATVHKATGSYTIAVEGNGVTVDYVAEGASFGESTPSVTPVTLGAYKLGALVKLSEEIVADSAVDFVNYVVEMCAKGFAKKEEAEFINGSGSSNAHVTGIVTALKAESTTPNVVPVATAETLTWSDIKKLMSAAGAYRKTSIFVMSQTAADAIHEFKNGSQYIFPQDKPLESIQGRPVVICENMDEADASAADKYPILFGDWSYYHIVDRADMRIRTLNELYAANGQIGVRADERIDAKPSLLGAFKLLKLTHDAN